MLIKPERLFCVNSTKETSHVLLANASFSGPSMTNKEAAAAIAQDIAARNVYCILPSPRGQTNDCLDKGRHIMPVSRAAFVPAAGRARRRPCVGDGAPPADGRRSRPLLDGGRCAASRCRGGRRR